MEELEFKLEQICDFIDKLNMFNCPKLKRKWMII